MPPIPVECMEYPAVKRTRTRFHFDESKNDMKTYSSDFFSKTSRGINIIGSENNYWMIKNRTFVETKRVLQCQGTQPCRKRTNCVYTEEISDDTTASTKRTRYDYPETSTEDILSQASNIIKAVERLSTKSDLIADGSRDNILPTIPGKHSDLRSITPDTMSAILDGVYDNKMDSVTIIDCRYPYEFEGGHIQGAINLYTKDMVETFLKETVITSNKTHVLIFHCEFSSERGPKMYRFLRSIDRELNKDNYPRLNFPEIYLLEGGYKAFFHQHQEHCYPQTYKPMLHKEHKDELRHFRIKSKSWSAGEKTQKRLQVGAGLRLRF